MYFDQSQFEIRCEWGARGVSALAPINDVVIIVDVLSFSTTVEIAVSKGTIVFPYRWRDESALAFAASQNALLAGHRDHSEFSLSPTSLQQISAGTKLVLPSPNGATLSMMSGATPTVCGCLRNARAVAAFAQSVGHRIAVIPAGEKWEDGSLRPAVEDWLGAGAIIHHLAGTRSPEAQAAAASFEHANPKILHQLESCASGQELIERGYGSDVILAAEVDVSHAVPLLVDGAYMEQSTLR